MDDSNSKTTDLGVLGAVRLEWRMLRRHCNDRYLWWWMRKLDPLLKDARDWRSLKGAQEREDDAHDDKWLLARKCALNIKEAHRISGKDKRHAAWCALAICATVAAAAIWIVAN